MQNVYNLCWGQSGNNNQNYKYIYPWPINLTPGIYLQEIWNVLKWQIIKNSPSIYLKETFEIHPLNDISPQWQMQLKITRNHVLIWKDPGILGRMADSRYRVRNRRWAWNVLHVRKQKSYQRLMNYQ